MITPAALDAAYRAQPEAALARRRAAPLTIAAQTRAMLAWMKTHAGGRLGASEVGRTWIWSDLHLDHAEVVWCFNWPFQTSQAMLESSVAHAPRTGWAGWRGVCDEEEVTAWVRGRGGCDRGGGSRSRCRAARRSQG